MIDIRSATVEDMPELIALLEEMDRFYGATEFDSLDVRHEQVRDALFGAHPAAHTLLAWSGPQLVGFATYSFVWPAVGLTRSLYLKELYVAEAARFKGVGKRLIQRLAQVALDTGCSRIEWTTDDDNRIARRFYEALKTKVNTSKLFYRVEGRDQISLLATSF